MKKTFAFLLLSLAVPAAARFSLRSEVPISEPVYGVAREITHSDARIATNGDEYLAAWTDSREGGEPSVYAARLRADGTLIDPLGIRIAGGAHAGPIVWTGSKWLIAYELEPAYRGYVRTMTTDGVFGEPIEVGQSARSGVMATNGTNVLLVLPNAAMLLDLDGNKLKNVALTIGETYASLRVAAAGTSYLVAATSPPSVLVQSVSSDGVVGTLQTLASPQTFRRPALASDGEHFLIVWPDKKLYAQRLNNDGTPDGPIHTLVVTANAEYPAVVWRDGEYLLLFADRYEIVHYAVRIAADGSAIGAPKRLGHDYRTDVDIAAHGRGGIALFFGTTAAVFDDASVDSDDVFRRRVDVPVTARVQTRVHLARLGDGYVAAWVEDGRIFLSTAAGTTPVAVTGSSVMLIDVLVDRSNVIWVLWEKDSKWFATSRFFANLQAVDPGPIYIEIPGHTAITAAAAAEGVIALAYAVGDDSDYDLAALLLWETGSGIARKDVLLTTQPFADYGATIAFDGHAFVYAWSHARGPFSSYGEDPLPTIELVGARVTPDGTLLDTSPVRIADDIGPVSQIDSARGANGVAIAWQSEARTTRAALFGGTPVDLGGPYNALGELAPHEGGFLLVRGVARRTPELTEVESIHLGADLSIRESGTLPPYEADAFWKPFDIDVIGGPNPVFAYVKSANGGRYGHVARVFVRSTGEALPRRRRIR